MQSLSNMGLHDTVACLQQESRLELEPEIIKLFRKSVLAGDWTSVQDLVSRIKISRGAEEVVQYHIATQKYMELLEAKNKVRALQVLRKEISKLPNFIGKLPNLSRLTAYNLDC